MNKFFFKTPIKKDLNVQSIFTIHYQALTKNYVAREESHDFWEIIYADKSKFTVVTNGVRSQVQQGEMFFIAPNVCHYVISADNEPNIFIISFYCTSKAMKFFANKKLLIEKKDRILLQEIMKEAENTFYIPDFDPDLNELKFKPDRSFGGLQAIASNLELLLIKLLRHKETNDEHRFMISAAEASELKDVIIQYLSERIYSDFSLSELCDHVHYKKAWLCSYFLKSTGAHIYKTYIKMKIDEAKKLIREGYSFKEISEMLQYDNTAYFSASFKKYTGLTPKEYKESIK